MQTRPRLSRPPPLRSAPRRRHLSGIQSRNLGRSPLATALKMASLKIRSPSASAKPVGPTCRLERLVRSQREPADKTLRRLGPPVSLRAFLVGSTGLSGLLEEGEVERSRPAPSDAGRPHHPRARPRRLRPSRATSGARSAQCRCRSRESTSSCLSNWRRRGI